MIPTHDPSGPDARSRRIARLFFAAALLLLALWAVRSYLPALAWAVVIAVAVWPLYVRFAAALPARRRRFVAPLAFTLLAGMVVAIPLGLVLVELGREGQVLLEWLGEAQKNGVPVPDWLGHVPVLGEHLAGWWGRNLKAPGGAAGVLGGLDKDTLAGWTSSLGGQLLHRLFLVLLTLMALFLLLRDGASLGERLLVLADRWLGGPGERLAEKTVGAVRGTVNGTVVVALGEGTLIGLGYVAAGVPHPMLFAVLTVAFAMLPLGAWVAFTAAALFLVGQGGSFLAAGGLFAFGAAVMLAGDNFVQPALIGGAIRLPFLLTLIGILGGLESFGIVGLFLGPVIMASLLTIWREWVAAPEPGETAPP
jgi:predicted PurR-regulated permease PerM